MTENWHIEPIPNPNFPDIIAAGKNVGLDLTKPIDLSNMKLLFIGTEPILDENGAYFIRTTHLFADVINENGNNEFLEIKISLKSERRATF